MTLLTEALRGASADDRDLYRPVLFRPAARQDRAALEDLLKRETHLTVFDHLHGQLMELVKALDPSMKYSSEELDAAARSHLGTTASEDYGAWVHYPWSNRLVHLLDEAEFAMVRTDRNRNKITSEEQSVLASKKVGVIGLSVGQSVALTMAQERSFGELRLADFDTLELSNLNRIRSGVHQLGLSKVVNTAREIAEIDPYLKVVCFTEGISEANIDRFLSDGGKLDLLIEECDSVAVKIIARQRAKALRIPVVMDTSDRGLIDVERFDLEPDRPILHGLVDHLDLALAAEAKTNEQKLPFVVPIIGLETMSKRMKASMLEIESTVGTWPQLATSVVLGGALVADIHRRIALGQFTSSGRWFVDSEELLRDAEPLQSKTHDAFDAPKALDLPTMQALAERCALVGASIEWVQDDALALVEAAMQAPSAGNLQPWKFLLHEGRLYVFHDGALGDSALDSGRLIPAVDMGACLENMSLKASELGLSIALQAYPIEGDHRLVAVITVSRSTPVKDPLANMIGMRCTNRRKGDARSMPLGPMKEMRSVVLDVDGCDAHFLTHIDHMRSMAETIAKAERIRVLNPIGHHELFEKEMRWSTSDAARTRDGLDLPTMELKLTEEVGFRVAADRKAMDLLALWDAGRAFMKMTREAIASSSAIVLISCTSNDPRSLLDAGRAVERLWLKATEMGLAATPCSAPILLSHHVRHGQGSGLQRTEKDALLQLFGEVQAAFGIGDREPIFLLRLSYAEAPSARSLRRPLQSFLFSHQNIPA
ncbi:MAG: Rv1355c family protein [Flavobacteriales bacterium]|nr:Rv1355c family protein [Flavobacteriales bacterium]